MIDPRYQEVPARGIPLVSPEEGASIRIISGTIGEITGPVQDIVGYPEFLDVTLEPDVPFTHEVRPEHTAAAYVIGGSGSFDLRQEDLPDRTMVLYGQEGIRVHILAGSGGVRFLYLSGKPHHDPIAWRGPIVMNTEEELRQAFAEYRKGTFTRKR